MKYLLLTLSLIFIFPAVTLAAESITDFTASYEINPDGTVDVVETIVYDFGSADRHGIFRNLLKQHPQGPSVWYKNRYVEIEVLSVTRDGNSEPHTVSDSRSQLDLKIGDANIVINGPHTYQITYRLVGALSYGNEGAEFYWNVTGNGWPVTIESVKAEVTGQPSSLLLPKAACYEGSLGATTACSSLNREEGAVTFTADTLLPGEGLTIATEVDSDQVVFLSTERISYLPFGFGLAIVWLLYLGRLVYKYRVEFKIDRLVIAQYEPYQDYPPMYTGVLMDNRLDPKDITAGILYLALKGFIKITKTEQKVLFIFDATDYELTLLRPASEAPNKFLESLLGLLFIVDFNVVPQTTKLSNLAKHKTNNAAIIRSLNSQIKTDIKEKGYFVNPKLSKKVALLAVLTIFIFAPFIFVDKGGLLIMLVTIVSVILLVSAVVPRATQINYEARNHLEGFKLFLSVTDKDRFDFHNAPEKSPDLFMKYLPYAVAFGVEKKWAEVFKDITIAQPDWYKGDNFGTFTALALTNDISAFSTAFSTSSGTSGSSGGGSSGGGGGGGGGGSW